MYFLCKREFYCEISLFYDMSDIVQWWEASPVKKEVWRMKELELLYMTQKEFDNYYVQAVESYANELLNSGRFPDARQAHEFALWEYNDIFPQGIKTPGTYVFHIYVYGNKAGAIWMLREQDAGFIGDFFIDSVYQHRGYGTKALCCMEQIAAQSGMKKMRLGVFKNNRIARKLYEKQGYIVIRDREADLLMEKAL